MASKKPVKKTLAKKTAKKTVEKKSVKPKESVKAPKGGVKAPKKGRHLKPVDDDALDERDDILRNEEEVEEVPDEAELSKASDAAEREASRLDLEEVAKQADRLENRQPSDVDGTEGVSKEDQLALAGVVPPSRPTTVNSDEYDPESVDAMADFKARSVLETALQIKGVL